MATLDLPPEQGAVITASESPMEDSFGDGVSGSVTLPAYQKYKTLQSNYKDLVKNTYKSLLAAFMKAVRVAPSYQIVSSFENGFAVWGDPNFANGQVRYYKEWDGYVHIRCLLRTPTTAGGGATAFTLPVGYRPDSNYIFPSVSNNGFAPAYVTADGSVVYGGTWTENTWWSLDISFKAA